jgi:hypothetical protein
MHRVSNANCPPTESNLSSCRLTHLLLLLCMSLAPSPPITRHSSQPFHRSSSFLIEPPQVFHTRLFEIKLSRLQTCLRSSSSITIVRDLHLAHPLQQPWTRLPGLRERCTGVATRSCSQRKGITLPRRQHWFCKARSLDHWARGGGPGRFAETRIFRFGGWRSHCFGD